MTSSLTSSNRINIPAVCRIHDPVKDSTAGTAVLIGPGILLTSTTVVGSVTNAATLVASFFESTKKKPVHARLMPDRVFFAAAYPEYMDYCLVACDEGPVINVTPVSVPLVRKEWATVREGDLVLVVQHCIAIPGGDYRSTANTCADSTDGKEAASYGGTTEVPLEHKRFDEILRCRNDLFFLKAHGSDQTAGCPVFNERGQLVGMQSQLRNVGEGVINRVVSIVSIVKHLFVNGQLARLPQSVTFDDVWDTWFLEQDVSRITAILTNFTADDMVRSAILRLCHLTDRSKLVRSVVECNGIPTIISSAARFQDDEVFCCAALRALWNLSVGEEESLEQIIQLKGVDTILKVMELYSSNEDLMRFGTVLLHNLAKCSNRPEFSDEQAMRSLSLVMNAVKRFRQTSAQQKFGIGFLTTLIMTDGMLAMELVRQGLAQHLGLLMETERHQVFLMEVVMECLAELAQYRGVVQESAAAVQTGTSVASDITQVTNLVIDVMLEYRTHDLIQLRGNRALWGLGNDPSCRSAILLNPRSTEAFQVSLPALVASIRYT